MKRAFPQKIKPVSYQPPSSTLAAERSDRVFSGGNRRSRTSAAMIGLALSMGASSLLIPRQDDGAAAAEPQAAESTVAELPETRDVALASTIDAFAPTTEHTVVPGETLWQIARKYQVSVEAIAEVNDLSLDIALQPGQVIEIPSAEPRVPGTSLVASAAAPQIEAVAPVSEADAVLKLEQQDAVDNLAQKRDRLSDTLSEYRATRLSESVTAPELESEPIQTAQALPTRSPVVVASSQTEEAPLDAASLELPEIDSSSTVIMPSGAEQVAVIPESEATPDEPTSVALNSSVLESEPAESITSIIYRVSPGDTVNSLARRYSVSPSAIIAENRISNPNVIYVGQTLHIPVDATSAAESSVSEIVQSSSTTLLAHNPVSPEAEEVTQAERSTLTTGVPTVPTSGESSGRSLTTVPTAALSEASSIQDESPQQVSLIPQTAILASEESVADESELEPTNPYVEGLLAEIYALRDRYRSESMQAIEPSEPTITASVVSTVPTASALLDAPMATEVATQTTQSVTQNTGGEEEAQIVAVAPLDSESYAPLIEPITGRIVSPDLPPLLGADEYLPDNVSFDGYIWPADGVLTSGYGWRWGRMHQGIDIAAPVGTPIYAAADGVVEYAGWNSGGYGNMVEIRHADGSMTRYAHNSRLLIEVGDTVEQGEQIAEMGSTGYSTGPHVHFEVHLPEGDTANPIAYLP